MVTFCKLNIIDNGCFYGFQNHAFCNWVLRELRSNHAGETGAVAIYKGILWLTHDPTVISFAEGHLETERRHLAAIEDILPPTNRSSLLFLWRIAGFLVGMVPVMFGPRAIYVTIDAVERFVVRHYDSQIEYLADCGAFPLLRAQLEWLRSDEDAHQREARNLAGSHLTLLERVWSRIVQLGSHAAVTIARRI